MLLSSKDNGKIDIGQVGEIEAMDPAVIMALENAGFTNIGFRRAGRIPVVAKSTIAVFRRPAA